MDNVVSLQASIHRGHMPEGGLCIWDWKRGVRVAVSAVLPKYPPSGQALNRAAPLQTQSSKLDEVIESFSFLAKDVYVTATVNEETSDMFLNMHVCSCASSEAAEDDATDEHFPPADLRLELHAYRERARLRAAPDPPRRPRAARGRQPAGDDEPPTRSGAGHASRPAAVRRGRGPDANVRP